MTTARMTAVLLVILGGLAAPPALAQPADFSAVAKPLLGAVVNISSERKLHKSEQTPPIPLPPPFDELIPQVPDGQDQPSARGVALGSGFLIDPAGYVVTNNHVVEDAETITVVLHDQRELRARIIGRDARTDLALLKVDSNEPLPAVGWGSSDDAAVGEWVLAIGNPFGLGGTVTAGIISATARDIGAGPYDAFLQTDASINRGNSGGPMFNMDGAV
ncbi:MAG TPA: trypsin-like peptidase domain-containing protein, partial [Patescibacteria group bacterium]|nr:trypsin-like peptidase domain-containing protein [Patescibacteria group bacterium]